MRKIVALIFILSALFFNVCSAGINLNNPNWIWTYSNDKAGLYIDKSTIEYDPATDTGVSWALYQNLDGEQTLIKSKIYFTTKQLQELERLYYKANADQPAMHSIQTQEKHSMITGTWSELVYNKTAELAGRDKKLDEYQQEQKKKTRRDPVKSILDSIF